jgi:hypothetical protein
MPTKSDIELALQQVTDQQSFFSHLLARTLDWPTGDVRQIEDVAYGWTAEELNASELHADLIDGTVWQIQPFENDQPWGIFVLDFKRADILSPRRGMAGALRQVLRGLVASRRKDAKLPSWKREHLLFICTYGWTSFRFAYFRSRPEEPQSARLATFGWEPNVSARTVCEFNLPALAWPDDTSDTAQWVSAWGKAFDKEPLTKDFFRRFDDALEAIKSDLEGYQELPSAAAYTQAQLLLERLIFLYFLQNRGWLDQDRHYLLNHLREHLAAPEAFTCYTDFLDKLFWTLSTAPGEAGRLPRIPFMNGGLFDDDEFRPGTRSANPPLKVRNVRLKFVFERLLEAFNFTVLEDTPLNQEVAVDPEMLGKVFESIVLHAEEADPDAVAPDKRKATGSYYTPRIVVHFICREALYQYLLNHLPGEGWGPRLKTLLAMDVSDGVDEAATVLLKKTITPQQATEVRDLVGPLKCCDPAVGSGAFPVGLMHELVNLLRLLEAAANGYVDPVRKSGADWLHRTKANIVQNCLFGVDIQQQAIEICRLRLWLTLIVDYDLGVDPFQADRSQFSAAIDHISQLPNLEMNFHCGDSLHDHICGVPTVILPERASRHASEFQTIFKIAGELHQAKRAEKKKKLRIAIIENRLKVSRRIVEEELKLLETRDSALNGLFGMDETGAKKRERNEREMKRLKEALKKVEADCHKLEQVERRPLDKRFYSELRKLEGADFNSPFNFSWQIDFPGVFGTDLNPGFDIVVGNPPFVTARNPERRELYFERWPRVCYKNYLLVCPFFEMSFGLLKSSGQLGFIVSNAFAKRDLGKPLVEKFLPTIDLQKVVDCSGLMFPGHGTPTCIVFARQPAMVEAEWRDRPVRVSAILPGGGDLRTPPEESLLWKTIATVHDAPGFENAQLRVDDRSRHEISRWPWTFARDDDTSSQFAASVRLKEFCSEPVGAQFITGKDEAYVVSADYVRRARLPVSALKAYGTGEDVRDWSPTSKEFIVFPYDGELRPLKEPLQESLSTHLAPHREVLENCVISSSIKKKETRLRWFEFRRLARKKFEAPYNIVIPQIATHAHFAVVNHSVAYKEKAQAIVLKAGCAGRQVLLLAGVLNSALILDSLKKICFSKRESEIPEKDTYYEFSGGKLEELLLCPCLVDSLAGRETDTAPKLTSLSEKCSTLGASMSGLAMGKLFECQNEAYNTFTLSLPGHVPPDRRLRTVFEDYSSLARNYADACTLRDGIRREMIALQEEMDWLVYSLYALLAPNGSAVQIANEPEPLDQALRPFRLWAEAEGDYDRAVALIPKEWTPDRRRVWQARLAAIRDNEHIRRIEQPVYKRRWDEQWKVGNQWRSGPIAYAAEFVKAFEWWLKEKAEWWLEHKKQGGPVDFDEWVAALWDDTRVNAAWPVAAENYALLAHEKAKEKADAQGGPVPPAPERAIGFAAFRSAFRRIIEEETVPSGFAFGIPYDELKSKLKKEIPKKLQAVRGKLNVPRERFHTLGRNEYAWAGLQFKQKPQTATAAKS